jgi:hypothetical protein
MKIENAFIAAVAILVIGVLSSCGVRGNPQPPLTSPELGHGEPGFKRASEEFAFPDVPSPTPVPNSSSPREDVR